MLTKLIMGLCLAVSSSTYANLVSLSNQELTEALGQGGADLSWTLSLNHQYANDLTKNSISILDGSGNPIQVFYQFDSESCGKNGSKVLCRLAISPNNHLDEDSNKKWLVFKGIQGTLQIDKFSIDGVTILNSLNQPQAAMQISFQDDAPLKIRNFGFDTLSIETGEGDTEGYENEAKYDTYQVRQIGDNGEITEHATAVQSVPNNFLFDKNKEKGFMGLNVHGNLHMSGNIKIFSYNCDGSGRC